MYLILKASPNFGIMYMLHKVLRVYTTVYTLHKYTYTIYMFVQNFCTYYSYHHISIVKSTLKIQKACPYCSVNYTPWCVYTNTHYVDSQSLYSKRNMVHGTLNLTFCRRQSRLQYMYHGQKNLYHGQPYGRFDLNPMPESTLSPSQGLRILPLDSLIY
jgi:hypothetical protein